MRLILKDSPEEKRVAPRLGFQGLAIWVQREQKNAGLAVVTLNLHSQPRLPGSVVGERSMR